MRWWGNEGDRGAHERFLELKLSWNLAQSKALVSRTPILIVVHWYQYVMSWELVVCADPSSLSLFLTDYSMDCCSPTNFSSKVWERPTEIPLQKFIQTFPFIRNINCTGKVVGSWVARQKPSSLFFTWNFIVETKSLEIKIVWDEQSFSPDNWY